MKKEYKNKQKVSNDTKKQENLYSFPKHSLTIRASSLSEAQKKLEGLLNEGKTDK